MRYCCLIILLATLFTACKKSGDNIPPTIEITVPAYMTGFQVFDFVNVEAIVRDESQLQAITVDIQNQNFNNVIPTISVPITGNPQQVSKSAYLNDIHLESGVYYLKVWASDGFNERSVFREITVTGVPLSINNMFVISNPVSSEQSWSVFTSGSLVPFHTFESEYGGAAVNSYFQYLYTMGAESDDLVAYHPVIVDTLWNKKNLGNPPLSYYHKMLEGPQGRIFVTTTTGLVLSYGQSGTIGVQINAPMSYQPDDLFIWNDKVIVEQKHPSTNAHVMGIYYNNGGYLDQSVATGNDIVSWEVRSNNELYVFSNDPSNQAHMQIYEYANNLFWEPHGLPAGKVNATYALSADEVIIAHELGLYKYIYSSNSLLQIEAGHNFVKLLDDKVNHVLWCVENNKLFSYDYNGNQLSQTIHTNLIRDIHILYNK